MAVGDAKPFIAALITIDPEAFPGWKQRHGKDANATVGDLATDPDLMAEVELAIKEANQAVSKAEAIRKFRGVGDPRSARAANELATLNQEPPPLAQTAGGDQGPRDAQPSPVASGGTVLAMVVTQGAAPAKKAAKAKNSRARTAPARKRGSRK
jgi:hypothetical protein